MYDLICIFVMVITGYIYIYITYSLIATIKKHEWWSTTVNSLYLNMIYVYDTMTHLFYWLNWRLIHFRWCQSIPLCHCQLGALTVEKTRFEDAFALIGFNGGNSNVINLQFNLGVKPQWKGNTIPVLMKQKIHHYSMVRNHQISSNI